MSNGIANNQIVEVETTIEMIVVADLICSEVQIEEIQTSNNSAPIHLAVVVVPVINVDKRDISRENVLMPKPRLEKAKMNVEEIQTSNHNAPTPLVVAVVPVINVDKKDILQENVLMPTPGLKKAKMIVGTTQGKKA